MKIEAKYAQAIDRESVVKVRVTSELRSSICFGVRVENWRVSIIDRTDKLEYITIN